MLWTIRPDHITVLPGTVRPRPRPTTIGGGPEAYPAIVEDVADIGTLTTLTVRLGTGQDQAPELRVRTTAVVTLAPGDPCIVRLPPADITAWPAAAGRGRTGPRSAAARNSDRRSRARPVRVAGRHRAGR